MRLRRTSKYSNIRTTVDGIRFASKKEAKRYAELRLLEKAGEVRSLMVQASYDLPVNGLIVGKYRADFSYYDAMGEPIVEDVKGVRTPGYKLKKLLMFAIHGIKIKET